MASIVLINGSATVTESSITKTGYGIKLLKNDGAYDLLIGLNHSVDDGSGDYIVLKAGEFIEDWDTQPFSVVYFKSSSGTVPFRLYSQNL